MANPAHNALTDQRLIALILRPKPIRDAYWRSRLVPRAVLNDPANRRGAYQLTDWDGDEWLVYTRESLADPSNWSTGLVLDPDGLNLRIVRCNGPHAGVHRNRLDPSEPAIILTPHVHYAREKYLQHPRTKEDGYAVTCSSYTDLRGAVDHLAVVTNLVPDGMLML